MRDREGPEYPNLGILTCPFQVPLPPRKRHFHPQISGVEPTACEPCLPGDFRPVRRNTAAFSDFRT